MAKQNFYIYSNCDFTRKSAAATRMIYYAKAISNKDNNVYLISCCSTKLVKGRFKEIEPNIFVLEKKQVTKKIVPTIKFLKELCRFANLNKGSDTFILYPYPFVFLELFTVLYMIFVKKKNVFYELNEVRKYSSYFEDKISFKRLKYSLKKIIFNNAYAFLDRLLPYYTGLICISTNIKNYGEKYNNNTLRVPILTDPFVKIKESSKTYCTKGSFNIGFSGSIVSNKENLESFVDVINKLFINNYDIVFNLCGTINPEDRQLLLVEQNKFNRFNYYGNLNDHELSAFLSQQDLLVIPRGFSLQNNYGFSTKLSDYLNHQKIILLTDISDNKLYIQDGINGYMVPPNDENAMLEKLKFIIENFKIVETSIIESAHKTSKEEFDFRIQGAALRAFLSQDGSNLKVI